MIGFVVNPTAGGGRGIRVWQAVKAWLDERGTAYQVRFTEAAGDGRRLAAELAGLGVELIAAVGGDGTVQEVAHGVSDQEIPPLLGYIPAGSGNDFARGHQLPTEPLEAVSCLIHRIRIKPLDLLFLSDRIAVNAFGAGLDGQVAELANRTALKAWGNRLGASKLIYTWAAARVISTYQPCRVRLEIDGEAVEVPDTWMVTVANIPYYGGGMHICPQAVADDGFADVCVVSGIGRWSLLRVFPQVYRGTHVHHPAVKMYRGRRIRIEADRPLFVHADGEQAGRTPVSAEVRFRRLYLVAP